MSVTLVVTAAASSGVRDAGAAQTLTLDQPRIVIGRGAHADVRLPSRAVSDTHAQIRLEAGQLSVLDDGSTNGTTVNGQPVVRGRKKSLRSGDRVGVPGFEIVVESSSTGADPPERTMTVARRFLAQALALGGREADPPALTLVTGRRAGLRWVLPNSGVKMTAGRGELCEVVLDDADCSREHAAFERDDSGVTVRDLASKNGVHVAGRSVQERRLRHGDEVQLGRSVLAFSDPSELLLRALETGPDGPPTAPPLTLPAPAPVPAVAPIEQQGPAAHVERNALTIPPPSPASASPSGAALASAQAPASVAPSRKRGGHAADWIVVLLAVVILGVSAAALYVLLHGTPTR
ncbi:MAG: FHA domain-containing protein [Deltaproteobacteria bacterium]